MSTDSNKGRILILQAVCSLDPKEMKRQQRSELPTSPRQPIWNAAQSENVGSWVQGNPLWTAFAPESPWCQSHQKWCHVKKKNGENKLSVNGCVSNTKLRKEEVKRMLKGLQFWSEHQLCGSLMIKHQVEAMESGHSLSLLGDFQETLW